MPDATNGAESKKYQIMVSEGAGKVASDNDELKMFVDYALKAFDAEADKNTFTLGKLNLVCVKNGQQLLILTKEEKEKVLGK